MKNCILSCKNIGLELNDVSILENVNLTLYEGEFHLLMGENGAGKTSIVNILSGIYTRGSYSGTVSYQGEPLSLRSPKDAIRRRIITIHQDTCLYEDMTIAENLFANLPQETGLKIFTSLEKKIRLADRFFAEHGCAMDSSVLMKECSLAQKRKVELLKLYLMNPVLLILDEPVATVSSYDMDYFIKLITYFKEKGVTILCISHNYLVFSSMIDRFSVFQDKELTCTIDKSNSDEIQHLLLADFCHSRYPKIHTDLGEEVFCAENLSSNGIVQNISFSLYKGEILGFFGRTGSGKDMLSKILFGIEPLTGGTLYVDRLPARISSPQDAMNLGLAYVTDERNDCGLFRNLDLLENVYSIKENSSRCFWTRTRAEKQRYRMYSDKLNIDLPSHLKPAYLSGGEQQKLIMMRWLMSPARIFIFNEPTQSIDIPSKIDIYNMFNDLILKGASLLVFSSNLEELMGICDRIIFIKQGAVSGEISREESSEYIQNLI